MTMYILDTDICGFVQSFHPIVMQHLNSLPPDTPVVTTVITVGEDLSGWLPDCRRAQDGASRIRAYGHISQGLAFYLRRRCLPFDAAAATVFDKLKAQHPHIGKHDLSIAAIALSVGAVVVTRNVRDFQRIPDLIIEDWTI